MENSLEIINNLSEQLKQQPEGNALVIRYTLEDGVKYADYTTGASVLVDDPLQATLFPLDFGVRAIESFVRISSLRHTIDGEKIRKVEIGTLSRLNSEPAVKEDVDGE